jgi:6-pyruvoyltetrahydropterin/6-carboxytetrahydropterin synthase
LAAALKGIDPTVVEVPFNPTAENIAIHLVKVVAPELLKDTGVTLVECIVDETRKCSASFSL